MANPNTFPSDGRLTSLQAFTGSLAGSELLMVVSPGNPSAGVNYQMAASTLASYILPLAGATTGLPLISNGTVTPPTFQPLNIGSAANVTGILGVPNGGTGTSALSANGLLYGTGTTAVGVAAAGATAYLPMSLGTATAPAFEFPPGGVSVIAFGATGNGTTDDTTAIQAAINSLTSGGTVFFPPGTYKITTTLTVATGVYLVGTSKNASFINSGTLNGVGVLFSGNSTGATGLWFQGYNGSDATQPTVKVTGVGITITNCEFQYGTYPLANIGGVDIVIERCIAFDGFNGNFYSNSGALYSRRNSFDQPSPGSTPTNLGGGVPSRGNTTTYNQNDIVVFTVGGYTALIQCVSAGGTTGGSPPSLTKYVWGSAITDGTVTWQFAGAASRALVQIDTGASVQFFSDCDISGVANASMFILSGSPQTMYFTRCDFSGPIAHCVDVLGGFGLNFTDCLFGGLLVTSNSLINIRAAFSGLLTMKGCTINGNGVANTQTGISIAGGVGIDIVSGNQFSNIGTCVSVAANVARFNISNNQMAGAASILGANANGINVANGTSDYYWIVDNDFSGITGTAVVDGGTGTHKMVEVSGGLGLGASTATTGVFNVGTGFQIGGIATSGNVLAGNGTNFVSTQLNLSNLTGTLGVPHGGIGTTSLGTGVVFGQGTTAATTLSTTGLASFTEQGLTLLNVISTTGATSALSDTTSLGAAYNDYLVLIDNVVPSTSLATFICQLQVNGTFQNASYLNFQGGATTYIDMIANGTSIATTTTYGYSSSLWVHNVNSTTNYKFVVGRNSGYLNAAQVIGQPNVSGVYNGTALAVTGLQFAMTTGNLNGTIKIYGLRGAL